MLDAHVETCTADGFLEGWARLRGSGLAASIGIFVDGTVVARAIADAYRPDLLFARIGHGHYGYRTRLNATLDPGRYRFRIRELTTGFLQRNSLDLLVDVPPMNRDRRAFLTIEDLMARRAEWSASDLVDHTGGLKLEESLTHMGSERYVDVTHMFVLGRRADPQDITRHASALDCGELSASDLLRDLLQCEERRSMTSRLPSPYSDRYPYIR